jgi:hypothetical protein
MQFNMNFSTDIFNFETKIYKNCWYKVRKELMWQILSLSCFMLKGSSKQQNFSVQHKLFRHINIILKV